MTRRFVFKDGPLVIRNKKRADPQKIGEAFDRIADANDGRLTPEKTVAAAKSPRHALHPFFEWDDTRAGHSHRLEQARHLIAAIRYEDVSERKNLPAFISVTTKAEGVSYRVTPEIMSSVVLQLAVLQNAERDLGAWERRYNELHEICNLISRARGKIAELRERLQGEARQ